MMKYEVLYDDQGRIKNSDLLKNNKWLMFLSVSKERFYNPERLHRIAENSGHEVLNYTLRTLELMEDYKISQEGNKGLQTNRIRYYVEQALKWSEVSKCGSETYRKQWKSHGYNLAAHNEASADIYLSYSKDNAIDTEIIYRLIKTHGLIGQYIRGEVSLADNYLLTDIVTRGYMDVCNLRETLRLLNYCIIGGVSIELYHSIQGDIMEAIDCIVNGNYGGQPEDTLARLQKLFPQAFNPGKKDVTELSSKDIAMYSNIFSIYQMWYINAAIGSFSIEEINGIFTLILQQPGMNIVRNISFKPLLDSMFYDYNGEKKINVYKKRIIEAFLKHPTNNQHVNIQVIIDENTALVDFVFQPACERLIEFCVEAERTNIVTYNESITILFDQFGFRRDSLDRLSNEESYLGTMNDAETTTKTQIPLYVSGDSIVDVGSGGGVLLNLLEEKFPDKTIIGTDIAQNVIETLTKIKEQEEHTWNVLKHNFVETKLEECVTCIIFSSILHEIFSFSQINGRRFDIQSVKQALQNAYASLKKGGRIIIRDGVKTDSDELVKLKFAASDMYDFFDRYYKTFQGLPEVDRAKITYNEVEAVAPINYIREFLFTYTWGPDSFPFEVEEQFGYFTLAEYTDFIVNELKGKIVRGDEFLEPGYPEHLKGKYILYNHLNEEIQLPASNLFIVIEK